LRGSIVALCEVFDFADDVRLILEAWPQWKGFYDSLTVVPEVPDDLLPRVALGPGEKNKFLGLDLATPTSGLLP
jgi:hypothetical protein